MRFIVTDEGQVSMSELEASLRGIDPNYSLSRDDGEEKQAHLYYGEEVYGEIEVNMPGDDLFDDERLELIEFVEDSEGQSKGRVLGISNSTECICAIRVLNGGRESEDTLVRIDPIWSWFFKNRSGLMQADAEGYYDRTGLILEVK